jgi:hypothetical protein
MKRTPHFQDRKAFWITVFLLSVQPLVLPAEEPGPFERKQSAYLQRIESTHTAAKKQKESVLNQAAVRLDLIEQHFIQQGNHQFSFEASRMADQIRDGNINQIDPEKLKSKDLQGFLSKIEEAIATVEQNKVDQLAKVKEAYAEELKALLAELNASGEAGLVAVVKRELETILSEES